MTAVAFLGYTLSPDGKAITCALCGRTSHHPRDVAERYCGHCHVFHADSRAFDCTGCGRHIRSFAHPAKAPDLCNACTLLPGWFNHPELAALIDPENRRRPKCIYCRKPLDPDLDAARCCVACTVAISTTPGFEK